MAVDGAPGRVASSRGEDPLPADPYGWTRALHGLLVLPPLLALPPVLGLLDRSEVIASLGTGGLAGWVWASGSSWLCMRAVADGRAARGATILIAGTLAGAGLAVAAGMVVARRSGTPVLAGVVAAGVMAYIVATSALLLLRHRVMILCAMAASGVAGVVYLVTEERQARGLALTALVLGTLCLVVAAPLAAARARHVGRVPGAYPGAVGAAGGSRSAGSGLPPVLLRAALTAAYLLVAQSGLMSSTVDAAVGLVPLLVVSGFIEWRAIAYADRARRGGARPPMLGEAVLCSMMAALPSAALGTAFDATRSLSREGILVLATTVVLAAALFLMLQYARWGDDRWVCGCLVVALTVLVGFGVGGLLAWPVAMLVSATTLLMLMLVDVAARPSTTAPMLAV